jgi:putative hydrolase of the HAD superfamily
LFDLDNTLHDASYAAFGGINERMTGYIVEHLGLPQPEADALRKRYFLRYGATLLGLVRHHGVKGEHFLHHTHVLPGLEGRVRGFSHDFAALAALPGRKYVLTNAPADYTARVMGTLGVQHLFDGVLAIEDMRMFGHWRPKPDTRMLRAIAARLKVPPHRCVLVEDTVGHLRGAKAVGMGTVWMQRWLKRSVSHVASANARRHRRPAYVDRRVRTLQALAR